jgi:hypothetical protein
LAAAVPACGKGSKMRGGEVGSGVRDVFHGARLPLSPVDSKPCAQE